MTLTRKQTRAAAAAAATKPKEFLQSDHRSVANNEEVKEDDETPDSEQREIDIAEWMGWPQKLPSRNEDEEAEKKEEDIGSTQVLT